MCNKPEQIILDREGDPDSDFSPIVLVDRGNCSFIRKTKNVQEIGGAVTLIADYRDNANPENIIMIDDGTGLSVAIPTIMISKEDGKILKNAINSTMERNKNNNLIKEYVVLIIDFEIVLFNFLIWSRTSLMIEWNMIYGIQVET